MKITPQTKIHDLLKTYPKLERFLMDLNPKYKKLKNPVLRRTVARIATLTQVAKIGGYDPIELVNMLRKRWDSRLCQKRGIPSNRKSVKVHRRGSPRSPARRSTPTNSSMRIKTLWRK